MSIKKELTNDDLKNITGGTTKVGNYQIYTIVEMGKLVLNDNVTIFKVTNNNITKIGKGKYYKKGSTSSTVWITYNCEPLEVGPNLTYRIGPDGQ